MNSKERKQARANYVKQFIEEGDKKGVRVTFSVNILANRILFLSERQVYKDLKRGVVENNPSNKY